MEHGHKSLNKMIEKINSDIDFAKYPHVKINLEIKFLKAKIKLRLFDFFNKKINVKNQFLGIWENIDSNQSTMFRVVYYLMAQLRCHTRKPAEREWSSSCSKTTKVEKGSPREAKA